VRAFNIAGTGALPIASLHRIHVELFRWRASSRLKSIFMLAFAPTAFLALAVVESGRCRDSWVGNVGRLIAGAREQRRNQRRKGVVIIHRGQSSSVSMVRNDADRRIKMGIDKGAPLRPCGAYLLMTNAILRCASTWSAPFCASSSRNEEGGIVQ